jgi:hypothetical protein
MSMGFGLTKADFDVRMGSIVVNVRSSLRQAALMNTLLNNTNGHPQRRYLTDRCLAVLSAGRGHVHPLGVHLAEHAQQHGVRHRNAADSLNNFFFEAQKLTGGVL